jgi:hypothetical protein
MTDPISLFGYLPTTPVYGSLAAVDPQHSTGYYLLLEAVFCGSEANPTS